MIQSKKKFTKMLLNNWGGINHTVIEFNEYINLFSGKSGSGKSTVMDAIQIILYGSLSSHFLNKAADDAKNKRTVLSYLRGEQKDGTANRKDKDFCSQLVLELTDTATKITRCIGVIFEVGRRDQDIKNYRFFSHAGKIPSHHYCTEEKVTFSMEQMKEFVKECSNSYDNRGKVDINRMYSSNEAYLRTLNDEIFGYIDGNRFKTMEKSAIALKMTNGTGQFIRDYMFPKSEGSTIEKISEQLGAYREIKERIDDLENRIHMLSEIKKYHINLLNTKADIIKIETVLKYIEIKNVKLKLEAHKKDLESILEEIKSTDNSRNQLDEQSIEKNTLLIEVESDLKSSDYGKKKSELQEVKNTIQLLSNNSGQWRRIVQGLLKWQEDDVVTDYVSNQALHLMETFRSGKVTIEDCKRLKQSLEEASEEIENEMQELNIQKRDIVKELEEKEKIVTDLKNDRKPYRENLKNARAKLARKLSDRYGKKVSVYIFADLFDIKDEEWKNAIEGRLSRIKYSLITEPKYAHDAAVLFRKMEGFEEIDLINSKAIERDQPISEVNSLFEAVKAKEDFVMLCLKRYLGRIVKCHSVEELESVNNGVTPDCYSYSNYMFRHLKKKDYTIYACIGTKVSKTQLAEYEEEIKKLKENHYQIATVFEKLKNHRNFEHLTYEENQIITLSQSVSDLQDYLKKQEILEKDLRDLEDGSLISNLKQQMKQLNSDIKIIKEKLVTLDDKKSELMNLKGRKESDIKGFTERKNNLLEGYQKNEELETSVDTEMLNISENAYKSTKIKEYKDLLVQLEQCEENRNKARADFNNEYKTINFTGLEKENDCYDKLLEKYQKDFEPKYKEEFQNKYNEVYYSLRDNVIATIHGEIKAANRHKREINRMLAKIRFSDSIYQIDISPAVNENSQFYEMLMAKELDSKVVDYAGMSGQLSLGEDDFLQKYEQKIQLFTEKFMPVRSGDNHQIKLKKQEMEQYADYRNYLTFNMYECAVDENGNDKKNFVDDMAGKDSGGEGQNPKYVALLAGFAMLYLQQSNRDSRIKLVLLDEAFSKMDKERSEVCLKYARELELQLIVCVPDERLQSLIQNVDCVYGFRRYKNQISMMHIDKGQYLSLLEGF